MKLHRFFVDDAAGQTVVVSDARLLHQWVSVLRFAPGREVALFDAAGVAGRFRIDTLSKDAARLSLVEQLPAMTPEREVTLCFSLLKKDKNAWVLQKCTELGVSQFVPLLCERTEKTGFDVERAQKIVTEAAEQCGRTDIPRVHEPVKLGDALAMLEGKTELFVAEQGSPQSSVSSLQSAHSAAVAVGPEGGWSERETQLFSEHRIPHVALNRFTLRAETACVSAAALLA